MKRLVMMVPLPVSVQEFALLVSPFADLTGFTVGHSRSYTIIGPGRTEEMGTCIPIYMGEDEP